MLLEYNNTLLRPHYEAHANFLREINKISCRYVTTLRSQCEFIQVTKSCHEFEGLIDYSYFIFCILLRSKGSYHLIVAHFMLLFLVAVYSGLVFNIAYRKIAPNYFALMRFIKLSEHTTGIILAILSGLPELIKGHTYRLRNEDSETFVAVILGKNLYAKTFAIGVLLIYYPIRVFPRYMLRDEIIFLLCFCAFINMTNIKYQQTPLSSGIIIVSIWLIHTTILVLEEINNIIYRDVRDSLQAPLIVITRKRDFAEYTTPNFRLFAQFIIEFNPLKVVKTTQKWLKLICVICFPLRILLDLVIPAVDYKRRHYGWIKLFYCINIITLPVVVMIMYSFPKLTIEKVSVVAAFLSLIVYFTSRTDQPPRYHYIFCIVGLLGSIAITYFILNELLAVLNLVGILLTLNRGAFGLLLLSPFEILKVLVLGITIANYGYPNISYAYFFALGLIELAGFGITLISAVLIDNKKEFSFRLGVYGETTVVFTFLEIVMSIITVFFTNFNLRQSVGWFYIIFSIIFVLFILSIETHLIHPLGADHDVDPLKKDVTDWA